MVLQSVNLAARFLLELAALAALGYWGFQAGRGPIATVALGLGAPLLAALVWGTFASPAAPLRLADPVRLLLELTIFGLATTALAAAGRPTLAWILGVAALLNIALMVIWGQR